MSNQPVRIQLELMTGYELRRAEVGMAVLVPGVQRDGPNGVPIAVGLGGFLLSGSLCRELAHSLLEMAERIERSGGAA